LPYSVKILRSLEEIDPKLKGIILDLLEEIEKNTRETVKRSDFDELKAAFVELTKTVKELAEAQKKTEESLNKLIKRVDIIEERIEGISNSVGYSLENNAYRNLPTLLKKEGIEVEGRLKRRYYEENQLNIWGEGKKDNKTILILGEVKVRPSKKEIDKFIRLVDMIANKEKKEAFSVFVAHDYHPNTERYLREKGIKYYWSYELD